MQTTFGQRGTRITVWGLAVATSLIVAGTAAADPDPQAVGDPAPSPSGAPAPDGSAAPAETEPSPWRQGPTTVELGHELTMDLTSAYAFLPKEQSAKVLEANGSFYHENPLGIVTN